MGTDVDFIKVHSTHTKKSIMQTAKSLISLLALHFGNNFKYTTDFGTNVHQFCSLSLSLIFFISLYLLPNNQPDFLLGVS